MSPEAYSATDWLLHAIYMLICLLAIGLHSLILRVLHRKQLNTTTFRLIANQTVSEILYCVLVISSQWFCWSYLVKHFPVLSVLCGVLSTIRNATLYVSTFSMVVIAYDRYKKLYRPLSSQMSPSLWIGLTWVIAIAFSILNNINRGLIILFNEKMMYSCKIIFKIDLQFFTRGHHFMLVFTFCNIIPLFITGFFYYKVIRKVRERKIIGNSTSAKTEQMNKNKRRTTDMLIALVTCYFIITIPVYAIMFVRSFFVKMEESDICNEHKKPAVWAYFIAWVFCLGSILVNPFIILYYNPDFKQEMIRILHLERVAPTEKKIVTPNNSV